MSRLRCACGFVIVDQADNLSYKAKLLPDQHLDSIYKTTSATIADFVAAVAGSRRQAWIEGHFGNNYPVDTPDAGVISDILAGTLLLRATKTVYQCEQCGRLWLQESRDGDQFRPFVPEQTWRGALAGWMVAPDANTA